MTPNDLLALKIWVLTEPHRNTEPKFRIFVELEIYKRPQGDVGDEIVANITATIIQPQLRADEI